MSAEVENMFSVREKAWHGIGSLLPEYPASKQELLEASGLNWSVGELPVEVPMPNGHRIMAHDKKGIVRLSDETLLSIMGGTYTPIQPAELVDFAFSLLEVDNLNRDQETGQPPILFETGLSLYKGKVNVLLARIPETMLIGGADPIDLYVAFVNSHDGSQRFGVHVTPIRITCQNTMNLAIRTAQQSWSVKHSPGALNLIEEARRSLKLTWRYAEEFQKGMDELIAQDFTKREFEQMVTKLFPKADRDPAPFSKEQYAMIGLLESSPTIDDGMRYTRFGALNAITELWDWGTRFNEGEAPLAEKRTAHVLFGKAKAQADKTYSYLTTA